MKTLEEITYDAGRHALADQESFVNGIRQRTGTLLPPMRSSRRFSGRPSFALDAHSL